MRQFGLVQCAHAQARFGDMAGALGTAALSDRDLRGSR